MLVERKSQHGQRGSRFNEGINLGKGTLGSRFLPLNVEADLGGEISGAAGEILEKEGTVCAAGERSSGEDRVISKGGSGRASSKSLLGQVGEVTHGNRVGFMPSVGSALGFVSTRPGNVVTGQSEGGPNSKSLGKRPVESDMFPQKDKDLIKNFPFFNFNFFLLPTGTSQVLKGDSKGSGLSMEKHDGPCAKGPGQAGFLRTDGALSSGLDKVIDSVDEHSASTRSEGNNLILNNPMFERHCESAVQLDVNLLDPKNHSTVTFNDNNVAKPLKGIKKNILATTNKSFSVSRGRGPENKVSNNRGGPPLNRTFKEKGGKLKKAGISKIPLTKAINSMANIINWQVGLGADANSGNIDEQDVLV
ncbi:uncharacterized protein [Gossypium hirsutum]|uniref:Uncharacterized protein n=1 Tax=Gossypium hirsutum TaxID=3635 RepID=A0ABM2ZBR2_GOSHI|nr:uncharacterized protein LOC121211334 [Gossypium hirsutum]